MSSCPSATPNVSLVEAPWEDAPSTQSTEHTVIRCAWPESMVEHDNGPLHTLDETVRHLRALGYQDITSERVRQIELAAFRKLARHPLLREFAIVRGYDVDRRVSSMDRARRQRNIQRRGRRLYDNMEGF